MPRATSASSRPNQLRRLALPAVASAMPAEVPRTIAKIGSAATRMVMKTSRPMSPLQSRSLSGLELRLWRELIASESDRERREASPTAPTLWRPNYGLASARPKIATALLQAADGLPRPRSGPFIPAASSSEEFRQDRRERLRVNVVRLTLQRPQPGVWDRRAERRGRFKHEWGTAATSHHQRGHLNASSPFPRNRAVVAHDGGMVIGKRRGKGLHSAPEGRMPHPFNLGGGHSDVCHEKSNRVTSAIRRQGFGQVLDVRSPGLLSLRIVVVGDFVHGELLDLVTQFDRCL